MAVISYPDTLPDFKLGKSREQMQKFRVSDPFIGAFYTEKITDDTPVVWDFQIVCTQGQARVFQQFLNLTNEGQPFTKSILTEAGHVEHEVKFIEVPLKPTQITQQLWAYTGTIFAQALINPDDEIDNPELIIGWIDEANILDVALNESWGF